MEALSEKGQLVRLNLLLRQANEAKRLILFAKQAQKAMALVADISTTAFYERSRPEDDYTECMKFICKECQHVEHAAPPNVSARLGRIQCKVESTIEMFRLSSPEQRNR